jgi:hypothetical protein
MTLDRRRFSDAWRDAGCGLGAVGRFSQNAASNPVEIARRDWGGAVSAKVVKVAFVALRQAFEGEHGSIAEEDLRHR